jgi:hypothetical protein
MRRCAFCGLGPPRRYHFFSGLEGVAICDCCTELAIQLAKSPVPTADPVTRGAPRNISCRFCGRRRSDCEPGGHVGGRPEAFICTDCERWAAEALEVG